MKLFTGIKRLVHGSWDPSSVNKVLNGKRKSAKGYHFHRVLHSNSVSIADDLQSIKMRMPEYPHFNFSACLLEADEL